MHCFRHFQIAAMVPATTKKRSRLPQRTAKYQGNAVNTNAAPIPLKSQKKIANPILNRTLTWPSVVVRCPKLATSQIT